MYKYILLLLLILSPILIAEDCVIPVPGDVNGDCVVDIKDFEILSKNWLKDGRMPTELPILKITSLGVSEGQAEALGQALKIPLRYLDKSSPLLFLDDAGFQKVPTIPLDDPELKKRLIAQSEVDGESPLAFDTIDTKGLQEIVPPPDDWALSRVQGVLKELKLLPVESSADIDHSTFEAFDLVGRTIIAPVMLDTRVNLQTTLNDIPVLGPGEQHSVSFDSKGNVTQLVLARRGFTPGETALLLPAVQAAAKVFINSNGNFIPDSDIKLCYYAPPLSNNKTQTLIPHYDIGGTLYGPEGQQAAKLRKLVPAIDNSDLVPSVQLFASAKGNVVNAATEYWGGTPPYKFQWFSSSVDLSYIPDDQSSIEYNALPRLQTGPEVITVKLTDQNGVTVEASQTLIISFDAAPAQSEPVLASPGPTEPDFGVERGVSDLCGANQSGFVNRFLAEGIYKRFNWGATTAWEQDFKKVDGVTYIDEADIVFYCGHGYGGGFTFETNNDDGYLTYTDAVGAWGGKDLEWLTLLSCQVLRETYDSKSWATRWGPAFNGLHLLCGFQTSAYDWPNFGGRFADWTLGRDFIIIKLPPISIRSAWFQAKKEEQPSSVEAVVMGPLGPNNLLGGFYDYFWGKGPVSCDLRGSYIRGFWRQVYK